MHRRTQGASRSTWQGALLAGRVVRGAGRGRRLGFPTANLDVVAPAWPHGLYAADVHVDAWRPGVLSLGTRPTFGGGPVHAEVHVLDLDDDLVGRGLLVRPTAFLAATRRFPDEAALGRHLRDVRDRVRAAAWHRPDHDGRMAGATAAAAVAPTGPHV